MYCVVGLQQQQRVHCHSGSSAIYNQWFLANGLGTKSERNRHGNQLYWKRTGESLCNSHYCTMQNYYELASVYIADTVIAMIKVMLIKWQQEPECRGVVFVMFSSSRLSVKNTGLQWTSLACTKTCWSPQNPSRKSPAGPWENWE